MPRCTLLMIIGLLAAGWADGWNHASPEALDARLKEPGLNLVALCWGYQPSLPKSKALEKEWLSAASEDSSTFWSVDCEAEASSHICQTTNTVSYPWIQAFKDGIGLNPYRGPREASGISKFVSRLRRPSLVELGSEDLESFRSADDVVFIGYIGPGQEAAHQALAATADKYRDEFTFGLVKDEALIAAQGLESPAIVCHVVADGETRTFKAFSEAGGLDKFIVDASRPVIGELTLYNQQRLLNRGWPMVYVFGETADERNELRNSLRKFTKNYYDSLTCVTVDPFEFPDLQARLGLEPGVFPSGAVHQLSTDRIYPYPSGQSFDSKALQKWGLDVWQGRVRPWTPPGATTVHENAAQTKTAKRKVSLANIPGVNIRVGGRDEL